MLSYLDCMGENTPELTPLTREILAGFHGTIGTFAIYEGLLSMVNGGTYSKGQANWDLAK